MTGKWHGGKGDNQRKSSISLDEKDLRYELILKKTTEERKKEILKILEGLKKNS